MRFSLLSIIIIASLILLVLKITEIVTKYDLASSFSLISSAYAQEEEATLNEGDAAGAGDDATEEQMDENKKRILSEQRIEYTATELDILKRLSKRREELEQWEKDLEIKENILKITQEKIDHKIGELRELKQQVEESLREYNAKENKKIQSLVKIYENMKPKAAAKIFSELDIDSLLAISEKMKEDRLALILAKMDPILAKELTVTFAKHGKLVPPKE